MSKIWKTSKTFTFHEICLNTFLIKFAWMEDKFRVLNGRPWLFDSSIFSLKLFDGCIPSSCMNFTKEAFWVKMHNLLLAYINVVVGVQIGNSFGLV